MFCVIAGSLHSVAEAKEKAGHSDPFDNAQGKRDDRNWPFAMVTEQMSCFGVGHRFEDDAGMEIGGGS